jgi:hypothetical protein
MEERNSWIRLKFNYATNITLFEDYRLIVERMFSRINDPESYVGGSVSSW